MLPSLLVIQLRLYASTNISQQVSNILIVPVSYNASNNKATGYNVYYNPKRFEKQGYSGFSQSEDWYIWAVMIGLTHQVPSGPGPDLFYTVHFFAVLADVVT